MAWPNKGKKLQVIYQYSPLLISDFKKVKLWRVGNIVCIFHSTMHGEKQFLDSPSLASLKMKSSIVAMDISIIL